MSDDLVTIEKYQFLPEAEAARIAMQSEGIETFLEDAEAVNMNWAMGNAIGYIKLQVRQPQAEAAQAILESMRARRDARGAILDPADPGQCLACGTALQTNTSKCTECGWSYASDDGEPDQDNDFDVRNETETNHDKQDGASVMDRLVKLKRPFIIMLLVPLGAGFVVGAWFILMWVCEMIAG